MRPQVRTELLANLLQQQKNMVLDEEKCNDQKFLNNSFIMFQILKKTSNNFKCDLIKSVFEIRLLNVIRHYFAAFFYIRHKNNKPKYNDYILYDFVTFYKFSNISASIST